MKVTYFESITRIKTVELPEEYNDIEDVYELDGLDEPHTIVWDAIDATGWDHEYVHESSWEFGEHESTLYRKA